MLSNNKGINIPQADLSIPALTDKDIADLEVGARLGVDWVAMSFVRSRDDLLLARHYLVARGFDGEADGQDRETDRGPALRRDPP